MISNGHHWMYYKYLYFYSLLLNVVDVTTVSINLIKFKIYSLTLDKLKGPYINLFKIYIESVLTFLSFTPVSDYCSHLRVPQVMVRGQEIIAGRNLDLCSRYSQMLGEAIRSQER